MTWVVLFGTCVVLLFSYVILFGAPFLPTLASRVGDAFKLLDLKPGQRLVELGSGDGRLLLEAGRRGIYATGYELNPLLVLYTRVRCWRYRRYVSVYCRNYWLCKLPQTDAIYTFLLNPYMEKLDKKITQEMTKSVNPAISGEGRIKLVSFAFKIPGKKISKEINGMYLYHYK